MEDARQQIEIDAELVARLDAVKAEQQRRDRLHAQIWKERRILLPMLAAVLLCLPNFRVVKVKGRSMEPALRDGDSLVVLKSWRWFSPLHPGDLIVFEKDGQELVKRIVFVQNAEGTAAWPKRLETSRGALPVGPEYFRGGIEGIDRVPGQPGSPQRSVYVLGDNYRVSNDSRDFGPIPQESILGKVIKR